MLTVLNLQRVPEATFTSWVRDNATLLVGQLLWAIAMMCIASISLPNGDIAGGWYNVALAAPGLL